MARHLVSVFQEILDSNLSMAEKKSLQEKAINRYLDHQIPLPEMRQPSVIVPLRTRESVLNPYFNAKRQLSGKITNANLRAHAKTLKKSKSKSKSRELR